MIYNEQIIDIIFSYTPLDIKIRTLSTTDSKEETLDKKKFPFFLNKAVDITIKTTEREFTFNIYEGFKWNGADLPRCFWWLGSSRDNDYVIASMVHDYMLQYKKKIFSEILEETLYVDEYRRLTSLIFREILKKHKMNPIKANVEAWFVDTYQRYFNKKMWEILGKF